MSLARRFLAVMPICVYWHVSARCFFVTAPIFTIEYYEIRTIRSETRRGKQSYAWKNWDSVDSFWFDRQQINGRETSVLAARFEKKSVKSRCVNEQLFDTGTTNPLQVMNFKFLVSELQKWLRNCWNSCWNKKERSYVLICFSSIAP